MVSNSREMVRKLIPESFEVVDLSHTLEEDIPAYPTHARFGKTLYESYEYGDAARHYGLTMGEHTGTPTWTPHYTSSLKALPITAWTISPWSG